MKKFIVVVEAITNNVLTQEITVDAESKADAIRIVSNTEEYSDRIIDVNFVSDNILSTEKETILSVEEFCVDDSNVS